MEDFKQDPGIQKMQNHLMLISLQSSLFPYMEQNIKERNLMYCTRKR